MRTCTALVNDATSPHFSIRGGQGRRIKALLAISMGPPIINGKCPSPFSFFPSCIDFDQASPVCKLFHNASVCRFLIRSLMRTVGFSHLGAFDISLRLGMHADRPSAGRCDMPMERWLCVLIGLVFQLGRRCQLGLRGQNERLLTKIATRGTIFRCYPHVASRCCSCGICIAQQ
jgi:hypothetical protein